MINEFQAMSISDKIDLITKVSLNLQISYLVTKTQKFYKGGVETLPQNPKTPKPHNTKFKVEGCEFVILFSHFTVKMKFDWLNW